MFTTERMIRVELAETDAYRCFRTHDQAMRFVRSLNVDQVWWDDETSTYEIPRFKIGRDEYIAAKAADCQKWGCE